MIPVIAVLLTVLFLTCLLAPWLGTDSSDARSEAAHPDQGWYPGLVRSTPPVVH